MANFPNKIAQNKTITATIYIIITQNIFLLQKEGFKLYFLNDKHSKYQYAIYCRVNGATPYISTILETIDDVFRWVEEKEKRHNHYNQLYYIDNDFYKNKYPLNSQRFILL